MAYPYGIPDAELPAAIASARRTPRCGRGAFYARLNCTMLFDNDSESLAYAELPALIYESAWSNGAPCAFAHMKLGEAYRDHSTELCAVPAATYGRIMDCVNAKFLACGDDVALVGYYESLMRGACAAFDASMRLQDTDLALDVRYGFAESAACAAPPFGGDACAHEDQLLNGDSDSDDTESCRTVFLLPRPYWSLLNMCAADYAAAVCALLKALQLVELDLYHPEQYIFDATVRADNALLTQLSICGHHGDAYWIVLSEDIVVFPPAFVIRGHGLSACYAPLV